MKQTIKPMSGNVAHIKTRFQWDRCKRLHPLSIKALKPRNNAGSHADISNFDLPILPSLTSFLTLADFIYFERECFSFCF